MPLMQVKVGACVGFVVTEGKAHVQKWSTG